MVDAKKGTQRYTEKIGGNRARNKIKKDAIKLRKLKVKAEPLIREAVASAVEAAVTGLRKHLLQTRQQLRETRQQLKLVDQKAMAETRAKNKHMRDAETQRNRRIYFENKTLEQARTIFQVQALNRQFQSLTWTMASRLHKKQTRGRGGKR